MADASKANESETFSAIDSEATNDREKRDSRILYQALSRHREALGGQAAVPADDRRLSEKILASARSRSAEIAASQRKASARHSVSGAPIPWWLWLAWVVALIGLGVAVWYFK